MVDSFRTLSWSPLGFGRKIAKMPREKSSVEPPPLNSSSERDLRRVLDELREANRRLLLTGLQLQEMAEAARDARSDAESANRAKDEFLAALSHELRTPLNAILGWTHMLRRAELSDSEAASHAIDIIDRNARLQMQLISDLLDVSQIVTGKLRLRVEAVELPVLLTSRSSPPFCCWFSSSERDRPRMRVYGRRRLPQRPARGNTIVLTAMSHALAADAALARMPSPASRCMAAARSGCATPVRNPRASAMSGRLAGTATALMNRIDPKAASRT